MHPTLSLKASHGNNETQSVASLAFQLQHIPNDVTAIRIEDDTPTDEEWSLLGDHFGSIRDLEMDTGWDESLNDEKMPLHWPLERLLISSACGEVFRSPFVLEGKIKHLILLLTSGLRFEGPTSDELVTMRKEAIARGDAEHEYIGKTKVELFNIPALAAEWMHNKYAGKEVLAPTPSPALQQINLKTLELLENNALETFIRMAVALPHVVYNVTTLNIRSTNGCEFNTIADRMLGEILPCLEALETLTLTVGEVFDDDESLPNLYRCLPPNIAALHFRGPVSLRRCVQWRSWIDSFANPQYLPYLRSLSFVLDIDYEQREDWPGRKKKRPASEQSLRQAKKACQELHAVAEGRGISVEPFCESTV